MDDQLNALGLAAAGASPADGTHQSLVLRLDLFQQSIVLTRFDGDGRATSCHEVAPEDVAAALSGVPVSTGLLPRNCLFYARQGREKLAIYLSSQRRSLATKERVYKILLPGMVFVGQGLDYQIFAVKQRPGKRERLFQAPLPNVNSNGHICRGNADFPACSTNTIHAAVKVFFASEFNSDLSVGKSSRHGKNILDLWAEIEGTEEFPVDDLVPTRLVLEDLLWR